jgi:hypothetical protein
MDFFALLKNKPKVDETIEPPKIETPIIEIKLTDRRIVEECKIEDDLDQKTVINGRGIVSKKNDVPLFNLEEVQFRKGETIKVVRLENSILNQYKGYIGTIRDSQKSSDTCMVVLDALNSGASIRFPKKHLVKWCPYTNTQI